MYISLLKLHDALRWMILIVALIVLLKYFMGWFSQQKWKKSDNILGLVFTSLMDLQLLTGLVLYLFMSPIIKTAFQDFKSAMSNPDLRFYAVEHSVMMILAIALVHVGRAKSKKAQTDKKKFGQALLFFGIAYIIIIAAIPWTRVIG